jgi:site-specific DNA recombinase
MKAVAYYRVSSQQQAEKESIDLQKFTNKDFAKDKDYDIVAEYEDDGISGESIDSRPGFQKALQRITKGDVDVFLVYMVDRIGRFSSRKDRNRVVELIEDTKTHVIVSEDDIIFHWNNEKELNALEAELNDSRLENVRRGKRISKGHVAKRLNKRYSGGLLPYGVRFDKERGLFFKVPAEVETLRVIFSKLTAGWGLHRVRDYLNNNLERYPKRLRKFRGKPVTRWSAEHIRLLVLSDFYFTGKVDRTEKSRAKGIPPIDTGIELFKKDTVEIARHEMRKRRIRYIDPSYPNRQRTHSQQDKTVFTDALLHGIARCGYCGWKLGLQRVKNDKFNYLYYICRGRNKAKCDSRNVRTNELDKNVWNEFIRTLSNPKAMEQMILEQNFIVDKKLEEQKEQYRREKTVFAEITRAIERTKKQYQWGHLTDDEYQTEMINFEQIQKESQVRIKNLRQIINQPKHVRESVKKATQFVADQVVVSWCLERINNLIQRANELVESADNEMAGNSEAEKLQKINKKLQTLKVRNKVLEGINKILSELVQKRRGLSDKDRKNQNLI